MALQCGIVGLPNVGKSTLFNCLSNAKAQSANFPFCTIEPNLGVITVPDPRLNKLAELVNPQNVVPTTVEIVDIAGLVKGASKGEGLGNKFLGNIRTTDAILHVLRCFEDDNIVHVDGSIDPIRDKEVIDIELQLKDLETVESRMAKVKKAAQTGDKDAVKQMTFFTRLVEHLKQGKSARGLELEEFEEPLMKEMQLLTSKPILYVCNVDEGSVVSGNAHVDRVQTVAEEEGAGVLVLGAAIEADIAELDDPEEREMFLTDLGLEEPGGQPIRSAYALLDLQTYFTAGEKEVRAWTIAVDSRLLKRQASSTPTFKRASSARKSPSTTTTSALVQNWRSKRLESSAGGQRIHRGGRGHHAFQIQCKDPLATSHGCLGPFQFMLGSRGRRFCTSDGRNA